MLIRTRKGKLLQTFSCYIRTKHGHDLAKHLYCSIMGIQVSKAKDSTNKCVNDINEKTITLNNNFEMQNAIENYSSLA